MIEAGEKAPLFTLENQDGEKVKLADYKGQKVAIYFYPKDDTPGCTKQACSITDGYKTLADAGITVLGISGDGVEKHKKFQQKYKLKHQLLADTDKKVHDKYGVIKMKTMFGNSFLGVARTTFLVDETGKVAAVIKRPKVAEHADEIIKKFEKVKQ